MRYHEPADIWTVFDGIKDYDSFLEKMVVPGRFHAAVPEEVVKAYATAEHIMAHAWYHYPAMDEALVKLLRTLEMAVKLQCGQLGIEVGRKNFQSLIDLVFPKESLPEFNETLHWLRRVRNYAIHPTQNHLFGVVAIKHIRICVIFLNALFLPEQFFRDAKTELERVRGLCQPFEKGLFVLEHTGFRYIVHRCEIAETYFSEGGWLVLCAFHAVPVDFGRMLENDQLLSPIVYLVKNFQVEEEKISGIVKACGEPFALSVNAHPDNIARLEGFERLKTGMDEHRQMIHSRHSNTEVFKMRTKARFEFWSRFDG